MPVSTPQARLPLEPEEYPLYRPPKRIGCSGISIVSLVLVAVFAVLFLNVTPRIINGIRTFNPTSLLSGDATPNSSPGSGALETQTVIATAALPTATSVPASPTPARTCMKIVNTGGSGTPLRAQPNLNSASVIKDGTRRVGEGATLEVIGPDVTQGKDNSGKDLVWAHLILPGDGRSGYILTTYLEPGPCP